MGCSEATYVRRRRRGEPQRHRDTETQRPIRLALKCGTRIDTNLTNRHELRLREDSLDSCGFVFLPLQSRPTRSRVELASVSLRLCGSPSSTSPGESDKLSLNFNSP